ncbi:MAG: flavodoxin domain-containing protein [Bacteroidetes bacterium]|nr:flavodoxin domain-containing protein [Bacteroidota bacterium]
MMIAIIYISKHGTTETVALKLHKLLNSEEVHHIDLRANKNPDISQYNKIILGGSIHAGMIQRRMKSFCESNLESLLKKEIALFLCCMEEGEKAIEQFNNAFPEILRMHSIKNEIIGGEFLFDKMNFLEKAIVKKIAGIKENISKIDEQKIKELAGEFV